MNKNNFKLNLPLTVSSRLPTKSGQSIIEVVVSIAIAAILAVSLISTLLVTQKTSNSSKNTEVANDLAIEYMEQLRIYRNRNGVGAFKIGDCILRSPHGSDPATWSAYAPGDPGYPGGSPCGKAIAVNTILYTLRFDINNLVAPPNEKIEVAITVTWDESGGAKAITHTSILSK